jgi:hypothetical protein
MQKAKNKYSPLLYRFNILVKLVTFVFIIVLSSTLVSLPLATKLSKSTILNTAEEESANNNFNEEHHAGKTYSQHIYDYSAWLNNTAIIKTIYIIPQSVNIVSSQHSKCFSPPPEVAALFM